MDLEVIILAAGKGTRMYSQKPKVLHTLGGKPMLAHVIAAARKLGANTVHLVVGYQAEQIRLAFDEDKSLDWVEQTEQLGTGHAAMQAAPALMQQSNVLILYGDVPLLNVSTLNNLLEKLNSAEVAVLTLETPEPFGFGRIVRDQQGSVVAIIEEKDASEQQKKITEINSGIIAVKAKNLCDWLQRIKNKNAQGEYYLTDIIGLAHADGAGIETLCISDSHQVQGVNDRLQLSKLERYYQKKQAEELALKGMGIVDTSRFDLRGELVFGEDCEMDINVVLQGKVSLGKRVRIGPNVSISNSSIGDDCIILTNSVIEGAEIKGKCSVGPFARIRQGTILEEKVKIGNFVETKKSSIGTGSKISHLSYAGDAIIGSEVNIGAGTITCNYDGVNKYVTHIEDGAFIGSNTSLVAPVSVGKQATVAAGSTITSDVPQKNLSVARQRQRNIEGWKRPEKK